MNVTKYIFGLILIASVYSLILLGKMDQSGAKDYFYLVLGVLSAVGLYHVTNKTIPPTYQAQPAQNASETPVTRQQVASNPQASAAAVAAAQIK